MAPTAQQQDVTNGTNGIAAQESVPHSSVLQ